MAKRVLLAPDSFKGSLSAIEAALAMQRGIAKADSSIETIVCPIADGGEGTVEAVLAASRDAKAMMSHVTGPMGETVQAKWAMMSDGSAVLELASAAGLTLVPEPWRDPMRTTTYGVGELMLKALDQGAKRIILGVGGSATNDAGCGCLQALGIRFIDERGYPIPEPMRGKDLASVAWIDASQLDPRLLSTELCVACDVTNPLTGPNGSAHIYAPQKGALPNTVLQLDAGLQHIAERFRQDLQKDVEHHPGSGAAGGIAAGLLAACDAKLVSGIELILKAVNFDAKLASCDLCLTGEGKLDGQSLSGKAIVGIVDAAKQHHVPVWALVGCVGDEVEAMLIHGLAGYRMINTDASTEESMRHASAYLEQAACDLMKAAKLGR